MPHVIARIRVEDYPRWKKAFDEGRGWLRERGEKSFELYRREHDSTDLTLLFEWDEIGVARDVFGSVEWRRWMEAAGMTGEPSVRFLQLLDRG